MFRVCLDTQETVMTTNVKAFLSIKKVRLDYERYYGFKSWKAAFYEKGTRMLINVI